MCSGKSFQILGAMYEKARSQALFLCMHGMCATRNPDEQVSGWLLEDAIIQVIWARVV